jgi:two-component system, sensor histidine kinase and response regulator
MEEITKPKILYVDDEENNLIVFKASLRRHYDIYVSKSGEEALKIVQDNDIDIIITDQRMPGMTGVEFLKQLPEDQMAIRMVLTGFSDVSAIIDAINTGKVYRYITKPWNKEELKITIDNAIEALRLRKKNQALINELQEANERLEQKVEKRTAALHTALTEINQQKSELEELNATKDKFFSIVAHDLRGPISSLSGFSAMLSQFGESMSPTEISSLATELNLATKNTLSLVENLLTWAYTQMKQIHYEPKAVDLTTIINETFNQLSASAQTKEITLVQHLSPELTVYADVDHLRLVLRNLTSNAIKFTKPGGKVSISSKVGVNSQAEISISDTGVGINADKLPYLFKVGQSRSSPGTAGEKGTGLGLILCKEYIEKNGGSIYVVSAEGEGTTFTFNLQKA